MLQLTCMFLINSILILNVHANDVVECVKDPATGVIECSDGTVTKSKMDNGKKDGDQEITAIYGDLADGSATKLISLEEARRRQKNRSRSKIGYESKIDQVKKKEKAER